MSDNKLNYCDWKKCKSLGTCWLTGSGETCYTLMSDEYPDVFDDYEKYREVGEG